jgi:hypothetical protein
MGVKLTVIALADGKLRVNRWCMLTATEYAQQIENLWITQIGNASERIDLLAMHLIKTAPLEAGDRISLSPRRFAIDSRAEWGRARTACSSWTSPMKRRRMTATWKSVQALRCRATLVAKRLQRDSRRK